MAGDLKLIAVRVMIPGEGGYVPPDPVCGGAYYTDKHEVHVLTCASIKLARSAARQLYPNCVIKSATVLGSAE